MAMAMLLACVPPTLGFNVMPQARPVFALSAAASRAVDVGPMMAAVPKAVEEKCMWDAGTYDQAEVEANWDEMVRIYGSEDLAAQAVSQVRGTVICPLYSNPDRLRESYEGLVALMGDAESKEILEMHPAILTCGDEVRNADPDEVRRLAKGRQFADKYITPELLYGSIGAFFLFVGFRVVMIKFFGAPMVGQDAYPM